MNMKLGTKIALWTMLASLCVGCVAVAPFGMVVQPPRPKPLPAIPADPSDTLRSLGVYVIRTEHGYGSGFSMSDTIIVTAQHVIRNATIIYVDGEVAELLVSDARTDVAILRVPSHPRPHLKFAETARGDRVRAVGYALHRGKVWSMVVHGHIAGFADGRVTFAGGVGPGMSGGPLFDVEGRVIGLASHVFVWQRPGTPNPTLANFVPPQWIIMMLAETTFYLENTQ